MIWHAHKMVHYMIALALTLSTEPFTFQMFNILVIHGWIHAGKVKRFRTSIAAKEATREAA